MADLKDDIAAIREVLHQYQFDHGGCGVDEALDRIAEAVEGMDARDSSVRLELLAEMEPWLLRVDVRHRDDIRGLLMVLRAKYAPKGPDDGEA